MLRHYLLKKHQTHVCLDELHIYIAEIFETTRVSYDGPVVSNENCAVPSVCSLQSLEPTQFDVLSLVAQDEYSP